jgi:hypothetical protein
VGFWVVDVEDEARAVEIAARISRAADAPIEVRQCMDAPPTTSWSRSAPDRPLLTRWSHSIIEPYGWDLSRATSGYSSAGP